MDTKTAVFAVTSLLCIALGIETTAFDNAKFWHPSVQKKWESDSRNYYRDNTIPKTPNSGSFLEIGTTILVRIASLPFDSERNSTTLS